MIKVDINPYFRGYADAWSNKTKLVVPSQRTEYNRGFEDGLEDATRANNVNRSGPQQQKTNKKGEGITIRSQK